MSTPNATPTPTAATTEMGLFEFLQQTWQWLTTEIGDLSNTEVGQLFVRYWEWYKSFVPKWSKRSITIAVTALLIGILVGRLGFDELARLFISMGFMAACIVWLIIFTGGSVIVRFYSAASSVLAGTKLEGLNLKKESAENISKSAFLILSWLAVVTLYASFVPIWNNIQSLIWLLPVSLGLAFIPYGFGLKPSPNTYKLIYKVVLLAFLAVTVSFFINMALYANDIIINPKTSEKRLMEYEEERAKKEDDDRAKLIQSAAEKIKTGTEPTDAEKKALKEAKEQMEKRGLVKKGASAVSSIWPFGKDSSTTPPTIPSSPTTSITQRDTLAVGTGWETVSRQLHLGNKIVFLSPRPDAKFKFDWQKDQAGRPVPMTQRADGLYWGYVEISAEPVDPNTRLQIKIGSSPSQGEKIVYWVA
ncbi:MAG TPA: hypothetical protein PLH37_03360 [bacterium]|nr:hypothetical protein [bacterium]